jgi:hypothetical protein
MTSKLGVAQGACLGLAGTKLDNGPMCSDPISKSAEILSQLWNPPLPHLALRYMFQAHSTGVDAIERHNLGTKELSNRCPVHEPLVANPCPSPACL